MKTVAGLDVHKDSVYLCILRENGEKIERVFGVFSRPTPAPAWAAQQVLSAPKPITMPPAICLLLLLSLSLLIIFFIVVNFSSRQI